jgi:dsRNA-specific ribonuclease
MDASGPPAKQVSLPTEPNQYKSKLNELAQKNQLPAPTYTTVSTPGGFFSTVTFNGREFKSSKCVRRKKESEQNASHMAMYLLKQVPTPPEDFNAENGEAPNCDAIQSMIAEARATSTTVIPTAASAKNRLQEYCQQSKLPELPKYSTDMRQDKTVISSVDVGGNCYTGDVSASKKAAEQSAAMKALVNLGLAVPPPQNGAAAPMES